MIGKLIGKGVKGSGHSLIWGTIPDIAWKN
jgi:hypothetical protein